MPDYIEFDPDGDVVLILPKGIEELDERSFKRLLELLDEDEDEEPQERACEVVDEEPDERLPEETNEAHSSTTGRVESPASSSSSGGSGSEPVFKSLLKGGFFEGQALSSAGTAEVSLPDDDPQALEILLNIIHGRLKKVPLEVSIAKLTELAILVDKYGLHEVSQIVYGRAIAMDVRFPRLLKLECFAKITKIALLEIEGPLYNNAETTLPIPEWVLDTIETTRAETLSECCDMIQSLLDVYHGPTKLCKIQNEDCDAMVLGGLLRALKSHDLLPLPTPPFIGLSFQSLSRKLDESSLPTLCERMPHKNRGGYSDPEECGIKHGISEKVVELEAKLTGLSLDGELLPKT